jgi:EAL domain-containing protein (putative c-di-GMP-specific phosphodiesterase class I)
MRSSDARSGPPDSEEIVRMTARLDSAHELPSVLRLRRAVERREWQLHYQPMMDLIRGRIIGVEALIRWVDSDGGVILPDRFLPLAEATGLATAIEEWVLDRVFEDARRWTRLGLAMDFAVNVSPRQLRHPDLIERLMGWARGARDPGRLVVEVTEAMTVGDEKRDLEILTGLRATGVRVAVDDFGTGYSSLARLRDFPVDMLKIDRSFLVRVPDDPMAGSMVRAIIQLAHALGIVPLAEGIETAGQWGFLVDQGCFLGQGYLFHHPGPFAEVTEWCRRERSLTEV